MLVSIMFAGIIIEMEFVDRHDELRLLDQAYAAAGRICNDLLGELSSVGK